MKKFKNRKLSKSALQQVKGGVCSSGCTDFYARERDAGEGDFCEFAFSGCPGTIQNGLCCA
ncbi:hypothetical protein BKI52_23505 [marine bacterium AO1-C]|nr:hypothetical protein BKI52_23505 [marine bacterium AO1-C]